MLLLDGYFVDASGMHNPGTWPGIHCGVVNVYHPAVAAQIIFEFLIYADLFHPKKRVCPCEKLQLFSTITLRRRRVRTIMHVEEVLQISR